MEKSVSELIQSFGQLFDLHEVDVKTYSPLTLAYIGDGVYELIIRTILVSQGNSQANKLHQRASHLVKASAQAAMSEVLKDELTEEELAVFKRGRNAHGISAPKSAGTGEYRRATGFEALFGYLWLEGKTARAEELFALAFPEGYPQSTQKTEKQEEIRPEEGA